MLFFSPETLKFTYKSTYRNDPDDQYRYHYRSEKLRSRKSISSAYYSGSLAFIRSLF